MGVDGWTKNGAHSVRDFSGFDGLFGEVFFQQGQYASEGPNPRPSLLKSFGPPAMIEPATLPPLNPLERQRGPNS